MESATVLLKAALDCTTAPTLLVYSVYFTHNRALFRVHQSKC